MDENSMAFAITQESLLFSRILIADDVPANVAMLTRLLESVGYGSVRSTTDSLQIVPIYQAYRPDLLLLDLKMPGMDGFQVLEKLGETKGDDYLPVIIVSAQDDQENRLRALALGARDFITKPFDTGEILARIRNMLELRRLHNAVTDHNRLLDELVRERTRELQETQEELLNRLLRASEFRDNDTGRHVVRIGALTERLARLSGLSGQFCNHIGQASMMHDIGKIGIPDRILLKPTALTLTEWETMMTHAEKGAQLLAGSGSAVFRMAERIAGTHHERWDGTGYPRRLQGVEIPIEGRITALADVFDALLSDRPYKAAWQLDRAEDYIAKNRGRHFDPALTDLFLGNIGQFIEIRNRIGT